MLGPSILFASPPFCTGYAFNAWRQATASVPARVGLILAGVELLGLLGIIAMMGLG
jgi:hypothetical protein